MRDKYLNFLNTGSIIIMFSIMYQLYFTVFDQGSTSSGGGIRFLLKTLSTLLFYLSIYKIISIKQLFSSYVEKIPFYYIFFTLLIIAPFLSRPLLQSLNLIFFAPLFLVKWDCYEGRKSFQRILMTIFHITILQLILEPIVVNLTPSLWNNEAWVGGFGTGNSFGLMLIIISTIFFFKFHTINLLSIPISLSAILTGSLASSLLAGAVSFYYLIKEFRKNKYAKLTFLFVLILSPLVIYNIKSIFSPISHLIGKLGAITKIILQQEDITSLSVSGRIEYTLGAIKLLKENPWSIIFGHPNMLPMYTGDGQWVSFIVTYGLPLTIFFIYQNVKNVIFGLKSNDENLLIASHIIIYFSFFFITNRIIDYWPMAFLYFFATTYLISNRKAKL